LSGISVILVSLGVTASAVDSDHKNLQSWSTP